MQLGVENIIIDFLHPSLNDEITAIGGYYKIIKEEKLYYNGGEILYYVGCAVVDRSCCGTCGCGYAIVAGYIVSWHISKTSDQKSCVSRVLSVEEENYEDVSVILRDREGINQVLFYTSATETKVFIV